MLNVILYPWSDCAIYSGHFIEISTEVEKSHWHHVVSVTLTSKRCNFKIKPQICISTWVLLNIKCFGCPWIFFWGIHGWHDVSVTCCQHEFVSKGCFKLNHLLVHVSIHNNNWSKCLLKLKRPIWKIWCQCDALYQKFANCPAVSVGGWVTAALQHCSTCGVTRPLQLGRKCQVCHTAAAAHCSTAATLNNCPHAAALQCAWYAVT